MFRTHVTETVSNQQML